MAKVVESMPPRQNGIYPWDKWTDGKRRGGRFKTRGIGNSLYIQFVKGGA